jgi:hypothetical protein
MRADILADKEAAKKKIEARRARAKILKEQSRKQQGQLTDRMTKAERKYMELHGINPNTLKKTDNRAVIKDKVAIKKTDASKTDLKAKKTKEKIEDIKGRMEKALATKQNNNIVKAKAGDNKKKKSTKDDYTKYTSIAAAKAAGSLYYSKNGKKMAAVTASDLSKSGLSLQDYMNFRLGKTRKKMNMGGTTLKTVPSGNTGLKKLPTPVRNKMGYMSKGGTPKKANKGMLIISIGMKKKKKSDTKKKKK